MKVKLVEKGKLSRGRKVSIVLVLGTLIAIGPFSIDAYLPAFKRSLIFSPCKASSLTSQTVHLLIIFPIFLLKE